MLNLQEALRYAIEHPGTLVKPENQANDKGAVYFYSGDYAKTHDDFDTGLFWAFPWEYENPMTSPFSARSKAQLFGNWVVVEPKEFFESYQ